MLGPRQLERHAVGGGPQAVEAVVVGQPSSARPMSCELVHGPRREPVAARLLAGEGLALDDQHVVARLGQPVAGGRAGGPAAHHQHLVAAVGVTCTGEPRRRRRGSPLRPMRPPTKPGRRRECTTGRTPGSSGRSPADREALVADDGEDLRVGERRWRTRRHRRSRSGQADVRPAGPVRVAVGLAGVGPGCPLSTNATWSSSFGNVCSTSPWHERVADAALAGGAVAAEHWVKTWAPRASGPVRSFSGGRMAIRVDERPQRAAGPAPAWPRSGSCGAAGGLDVGRDRLRGAAAAGAGAAAARGGAGGRWPPGAARSTRRRLAAGAAAAASSGALSRQPERGAPLAGALEQVLGDLGHERPSSTCAAGRRHVEQVGSGIAYRTSGAPSAGDRR